MPEGLTPIRTGHEATTRTPVREQKVSLALDVLLTAAQQSDEEGEYAHIDGIMQNVFRDLTGNPERKKKYTDFIIGVFKLYRLWRIATLPHCENRFRAFVLIYAQQRLFDDIIDGDTPMQLKPIDRVAYAEEKINNLETDVLNEGDMIEAFSVKILSDIEVLDPSYVEVAKKKITLIMRSIAFDGKRILEREQTGQWQFLPQAELEQHFFDLDIDGTIGLTLFLFGLADSEKNLKLLKPLGQASRVAYNLKDFYGDIKAGLCNVPKEDAERLSITQDNLDRVVEAGEDISIYPQNIQVWLREQIDRGDVLLERHSKQPIQSLEILNPRLSQKVTSPFYKEIIKRKVLDTAYVRDAQGVFLETTKKLNH